MRRSDDERTRGQATTEPVEDAATAHDGEEAASGLDRRKFLGGVGGVTLGSVAGGLGGLAGVAGTAEEAAADEIGPLNWAQRRTRARNYRFEAAKDEFHQPVPKNLECNGDEDRYANKIGSYSKSLPHDPVTGEVDLAAYDAMIQALDDGDFTAMEAVPVPGSLKLLSPLAGNTFGVEGPDTRAIVVPPAPRLDSAERAAEAAELYWMALTRDVPWRDFDTDPTVADACGDLTNMLGYQGPVDPNTNTVTPQVLFRMDAPGCLDGPYVSQVLTRGFVYDGMVFPEMKMSTPLPGEDFITDFSEWINARDGFPGGNPGFSGTFDPVARWIRSPRDVGQLCGQDVIYTSHLRAVLVLRTFGFGTTPYSGSAAQSPFCNYGLADLIVRLADSCQSERHAWFYKWNVHRTLRPEAFGGLVHRNLVDGADYPLHSDLFDVSTVLPRIFDYNEARNLARGLGANNGTYLLPQMFRQGCPTHPSYVAGHAISAGACVTVLKAFYDETRLWPGPRKILADGSGFEPYVAGVDGPPLTFGGEFNKLAMNLSLGRDISGVHWRSDDIQGLLQGEELAIRLLREVRDGYPEPEAGWTLTKFDGTQIDI